MSDWKFLNEGRQKTPSKTVAPQYCTTDADGFMGLFRLTIDGCLVRCVASDGGGWQHVSVSLEYQPNTCPSWKMMCKIKDLFWEDDDVVIQFHPAKKDYVNHHPGCLHLWRSLDEKQPCPPSIFVGPKPK